jgi:hypothetical protein
MLARWLRPLIPRHYRAVRTEVVAGLLLEAALDAPPGIHIVTPG